ncbi:MBL fold metallo-hydrolase [Winogradskyella maritima]|uniref:MBL fold metallo-hydrolase n=1 Tax=Winogradskyella maritima TaxID=1517766 RepID=A0ABV8AJN9_9FLAO|nr:MBL fold metallo-hydrolase [Winogradskyella maritima]
MKLITKSLCVLLLLVSCKNDTKTASTSEAQQNVEDTVETNKPMSSIEINPIEHATMVLKSKEHTIYVDPVGGASAFSMFEKPSLVLITDIHGDHLSPKTLRELDLSETTLIAPKAVMDKLDNDLAKIQVTLNNGDLYENLGIGVEAIPMYNLREEAKKFHTKGRGNGYVLTVDDTRIYISGDTEDIPEMRNLENIDMAFVCMNLPYTMTVDSASSAVLEFKPKKVYPYHYRGTDGKSDVNRFKTLVNKGNSQIEVAQLNWYN